MRIEERKLPDRLSTRQGIQELINTHKILPLGAWGCESGSDIVPALMNLMGCSRGQQAFFLKCQRVNIFDFAGHVVSDATIELCCYSMKAVIDNTYTNGRDLC